jgi:hypothetical protein
MTIRPSTELTRGPPELVQHFHLYVEFTSAQVSAACPIFDMVWLNRSPISVGGGGQFPRSNDFHLPSLA